MKPDAYRGPPGEGQFRDFVTRLLRVPKQEMDERERARKRVARTRGRPVKVDKEVTEEG